MIALAVLLACGPKIDRGPVPVEQAKEPVRVLELADAQSPDVYFEAIVAAGSAYDPPGQEGLAYLAARSTIEAGAGQRSAREVKDALFPTGNDFELVVDREWVSLRLTCHRDHAALCGELFADALVAPAFAPDDVARMRDESVYAVDQGILGDEEALAHEVFEDWTYEAHPYGHPVRGRTGVLPLLDAARAKDFWRRHYVREAMVVGVAGAYDAATLAALKQRLDAVPGDRKPELVLQDPPKTSGRSLLAVDTETPVTGFVLGHPLDVRRGDPDWAALYLATVALGEHRESTGRLYRRMRTARGLNYGDYAYVEPYTERSDSSLPEEGTIRREPYFSLWLRPTSVENGPFALKLALDELKDWVDHGLTQQELDDTKEHLLGRIPLWGRDPGRRLAYRLDAAATGTPDLLETLPKQIADLKLDAVNAAIKAHVHPDDLRIVAVTGDAEGFVSAVLEGKETPIVYRDVEPSSEQAARDAAVAKEAVGVDADHAREVPASGIFR